MLQVWLVHMQMSNYWITGAYSLEHIFWTFKKTK